MNKPPTYRQRLYELIGDNHGIITIAMAAEVGVPAVELRKLAQRGSLLRMHRGVYEVPFVPVDKFGSVVAALDSVGPQAFLVGSSVLSLFDIGLEMPMKWQVFSPGRVRRKLPSQVTLFTRKIANEFELIEGVRCQPIYSILEERVRLARSDRVEREIEDALAGFYISSFERDDLLAQLNRR